jgi:flagellar hook-associated protein 2
MGRITSGVGLASGINSSSIIDQLMQLEERPKVNLQTRIDNQGKKKAAYTDLQLKLTSLRLFGTSIKKPQTFRNANVNSSDEGIITGTASTGAAAGSYRLSVARLVTAQQGISKSFADHDTTRVGAGTMTLELGGGDLNTPTPLDELNGGDGIRRGQFRITDRSGESTIIDTSDAVTIEDVLKKINTSLDISVKASIANNGIVLTDTTGRTVNNLRIQDIGDGHSAEDLGLVADTATNTISGTQIGTLALTTSLNELNDGRGITFAATGPDMTLTMADGSDVAVTLTGATSVGDVISKINTALGSKGAASIASGGRGLQITDLTADYTDPDNPVGSPMTIVATNGTAASALGLVGTADASTGAKVGSSVTAGLNGTLISSLNGGSGLSLGTIKIRDRAGTERDINLAGSETINDILDRINTSGLDVLAEVKPGANGISLTDQTGAAGNLVISNVGGGTTAEALFGATLTFPPDGAHKTITGVNLQKAWFTGSTLLADLNGGKGVPEGKFKITDSAGKTKTITIDPAKDATVGDLMEKINNATPAVGVTASINANGDGLLLTDTAGGGTFAKIEDLNNGTTAKSLNILGTFTSTTLNGSWEKTIAISATDTLDKVQTKINELNWGVSASIINDGSGSSPYRLSLTSVNTGRAGRVVFSSGAVNLGERVLVEAQDAAVFVGSDSGSQPLLITSSSNVVSGAIRGVTLNLNGVSKEPVSVNIARNVDNVVEQAGKFVENFNALIVQLKEYTKFDSTTNTRGTLLGDPTAQSVESELFGMLNTVGNESGKYRIASDVGLRVGADGQVEFDESKFRAAYSDDPEAVTTLFTRAGGSMDSEYLLQDLNGGRGVRTAETGADFAITTRDGTNFNVDLGDLSTMGQVIDAINNATGNNGKVNAAINSAGTGINLIDKSTTGTKKFVVASLNESVAAVDLGLNVGAAKNQITGRKLIDVNAGNKGGIGSIIEKRINRLIDPVNGVVTRSNKEVDSRMEEFQNRIDSIDKLVAIKRARLERQFANLESSLSSLQGQQSALNSFTPVSTSR